MPIIRLRVPLAQYSYMEYDFEGTPEEAIQEVNTQVSNYIASGKPNSGLSQLLFGKVIKKYLVENVVSMEDFEALGSDKVFSQAQVLTIIKNAIASVTRDENNK